MQKRDLIALGTVLVGIAMVLTLTIWASLEKEASRCPLSWGHTNQEVWFGCEGSIFERRLAQFQRNQLAHRVVVSVVAHPPEAGHERGTTVYFK